MLTGSQRLRATLRTPNCSLPNKHPSALKPYRPLVTRTTANPCSRRLQLSIIIVTRLIISAIYIEVRREPGVAHSPPAPFRSLRYNVLLQSQPMEHSPRGPETGSGFPSPAPSRRSRATAGGPCRFRAPAPAPAAPMKGPCVLRSRATARPAGGLALPSA